MQKENLKGIFFDLYGTLLVFDDFDEANSEWENSFYEMIGKDKQLNADEIHKICTEILKMQIKKEPAGNLTTYETKIKKIFDSKGIDIPIPEIKNIASETVRIWQKKIRLAEDVHPVIREFKKNNKTIGLITNFDHAPHVYRLLKENAIGELFDVIIISDEAGCEKPCRKIFEIALKSANLSAAETVYIGDNLRDDIEGAFNAGINPILIDRKLKSHNSDAAVRQTGITINYQVIFSLSELPGILS